MPNLQGLIRGDIEEKSPVNLKGLERINTQVDTSGLERDTSAGVFEEPDEPKKSFADTVMENLGDKFAKITLAAVAVPKLAKSQQIDYTQAQPAFKYGVMTGLMGLPKTLETINKAENITWADVITESNPDYYDTTKGTPTKTFWKHLAPELGGEILESFSKPSTYITWKAIEAVLPSLLERLSQNPIFKTEVIKAGTKLDTLLRNIFFEPVQNIFSSPPKTSYQELGVPENAPLDEVKAAWKMKAMETHPDKNPNNPIQATQRFIRARAAYEKILSERGVKAEAFDLGKTKTLPSAGKEGVVATTMNIKELEGVGTNLQVSHADIAKARDITKIEPIPTGEWWKNYNEKEISSQLKQVGAQRAIPITREEADVIENSKILVNTPRGVSSNPSDAIIRIEVKGAETTGLEGWFLRNITAKLQSDTPQNRKAVNLIDKLLNTRRNFSTLSTGEISFDFGENVPQKLPPIPPTYEQILEKRAEPAHVNFMEEVGQWIAPELNINLPDKPIIQNINGFKIAIGRDFIRYYGLTPEARLAFIKFTESVEPRQDDIISFITKNLAMSDQDASVLTYHLENPAKYPIPGNLKAQAEVINKTFNLLYTELEKRKLLSEKFPETFITNLNEDITTEQEALTLAETQGVGNRTEHLNKIKEYENRIEYLKQLRYVPHKYRPIAETVAVNLFRGRMSSKLISAVSKIKGRKIATLDEAKALGLIPVDDIRVLLGSYSDYVLKKISIHDFIENLKKNPEILLPEKKAPEDWKKVNLSQLDGFKVHPYMADALRQYSISPPEKGLILGVYDSINRLAKTLIFYNPWIMMQNNFQQMYLSGSMNIHSPKYLWQGVKDLTQKTPFYKEVTEKGLFSAPYSTRPPIEEQIHLAIEEMSTRYPWIKKIVKTAVNPARLYDEIQKVTWGCDRIIRLATVHYYLAKKMPLQKAIDKTNLFFVDYSFIPDNLRVQLNRVFLTPTYRTQMQRLFYNFVKHPTENKSAIARLIGFHIAIALWASYAGYKRENLYRFVKKLDSPIETPEGKILSERVIVGSSPLFEYQKLFGRTAAKTLYLNLARVPFLAVSLQKNRDWKNEPIVDPALPFEDRAAQMIWYVVRTYIAPIEAFDRLGTEQQNAFEKILNALAIPVYKRQSSVHYYLGQIRTIQSDVKDYIRRHPQASEDEIQKIYHEAQKRMDAVLKKIGEGK